jgi:hypothetical protein
LKPAKADMLRAGSTNIKAGSGAQPPHHAKRHGIEERASGSGLASCLPALCSGLARYHPPTDSHSRSSASEDPEALERMPLALVAAGSKLGLADDSRSDGVIALGIGGQFMQRVDRSWGCRRSKVALGQQGTAR